MPEASGRAPIVALTPGSRTASPRAGRVPGRRVPERARITGTMYDVIHLEGPDGWDPIATGLDHDAACARARDEARQRGIGRMFLAGSEPAPAGALIVIVESRRQAA